MAEEYTFVAFDDYMQTAGTTATAYTARHVASTLGMFDQIAISVTAEQVSGSNPAITVDLEHSADGVNWLTGPVNPLVDDDLIASETNVYLGFSDGLKPLLRFVRLKITLTSVDPSINAYVRIDATLNDSRQSEFARQMRALMEQAEALDPCVEMIQGGTLLQFGEYVWVDGVGYVPTDYSTSTSGTAEAIAGAYFSADHDYWQPIGGGTFVPNDSPIFDFVVPKETSSTLSGKGETTTGYTEAGVALASEASVCVLADGTIVLSKPGGDSIALSPPGTGTGDSVTATSGTSGTGGGC